MKAWPEIACPLCESHKVFDLRRFRLAELGQEWQATFRFNPFADLGGGHAELIQHRCGACELEFFSPSIVGDAEFYARLSRGNAWYYEENKWEFSEAIRRLNTRSQLRTVLEIGCGPGYFLEKVAGCYEVLGAEINPEAVAACQRKGLRVTTQPLAALPDQFDAILAFEVLEHLPEPWAFLRQAAERLTPEGVLILAVPNPEGYLTEFDHVLLDLPPHHATRWSKHTLAQAAQRLGLELVGISDEPLRYVHYQNYYWEKLGGAMPDPTQRSPMQTLRQKARQAMTRVLTNALMPLGYQYHKQILPGQTHLAEFRNAKAGRPHDAAA